MAPKIRPPLDRFVEKVEMDATGCMVWVAGTTGDGYGRFRPGGRDTATGLAHRWSYERFVGPIPKGMHIDHLCRNRACVHPDHLEPVTNQENLLRGVGFNAVNAAKQECPSGHPYDDTNTYRAPTGQRGCKTCRREANRRWRSATTEGRAA